MSLASLLLLADSRLPSGGHVHSGGVEALVDRRLLTSVDDLVGFLDARIGTAGLCTGSAAAAATVLSSGGSPRWQSWDRAVDVRTPSAALREVSRAQGVALLRTVRLAWPSFTPLRALAELSSAHQPLVLGAAAAAAAVTPGQAAALAVHHMVGGAATAAVRLLGLDPLRVAAAQAVLAPRIDLVAAEATAAAEAAVAADDPDLLPADATPLPEILAELHHASEVTLFAS
ncbi:urease accessory protein UreF [Pseudonocardia spinosispora]|uniref:urease accessory protein UreF n=1 Tax=Pseudonocardia spinosispora TaxID=103441 RepID=UPI000411B0D2|nr:urease accessory UreF family protein [Pseudonocardia spinosispora]